nr:MAG TPA: hypothetical protein [Caudoviricetes sp.]
MCERFLRTYSFFSIGKVLKFLCRSMTAILQRYHCSTFCMFNYLLHFHFPKRIATI